MTLLPPRCLVVSCQAREDNPLHGPVHMVAMALAAEQAGARGLRANGPEDIAAIRAASSLPIVGISKRWREGWDVYITPDLDTARAVVEAGADIVAIDATARPRPGEPLAELIRGIKQGLGVEVFADVSTLEEGLAAAELGADYVATTLAGYTDYSTKGDGPDLDLLRALAGRLAVPVVGEGRFWTPEDVSAGLAAGAHAIVVGTAITNPREIARRFAAACA